MYYIVQIHLTPVDRDARKEKLEKIKKKHPRTAFDEAMYLADQGDDVAELRKLFEAEFGPGLWPRDTKPDPKRCQWAHEYYWPADDYYARFYTPQHISNPQQWLRKKLSQLLEDTPFQVGTIYNKKED